MKMKRRKDRHQFEEKIRQLADSVVCPDRGALQERIWQKSLLNSSNWLVRLQLVAQTIKLATQRRFAIRALLEEAIAVDQPWYVRLSDQVASGMLVFTRGFRKLAAATVTLALLAVLVIEPWGQISRVSAANLVQLTDIQGPVVVIRDNQEVIAESGMALRSGDSVKIGFDGSAQLGFLNDHVVRLGENSQLDLLNVSAPVASQSDVRLGLIEGEAWFNLAHDLGPKSRFEVNGNELLVAANNKGAFDLKVTPEFSRVVAVNNQLDLVLKHNKQLIWTQLRPEYMIKLRAKMPYVSYQERQRFVEKVSDQDLDWFERNLLADRLYQDTLERQWRDFVANEAGLTPEDSLYAFKIFKRKARLALAFDKQGVQLDIAQEKFFEAQKLALVDGGGVVAKQLLDDYQRDIDNVSREVREIAEADPAKAEELKDIIDDGLEKQKQSLVALNNVANQEAQQRAEVAVKRAELLSDRAVTSLQPMDKLAADESSSSVKGVSEDRTILEVVPKDSVQLEFQQQPLQLEELDLIIDEVTDLKDVKQKTGSVDQNTQPVPTQEEPVIVEQEPAVGTKPKLEADAVEPTSEELDQIESPDTGVTNDTTQAKDEVAPVPVIEPVQPGVKIEAVQLPN